MQTTCLPSANRCTLGTRWRSRKALGALLAAAAATFLSPAGPEAMAQCTLEEIDELAIAFPDPDVWYGYAVGVSGDWAIVGAPPGPAIPTENGAAHVFLRDDNGTPDDHADDTWIHTQNLLASDPPPNQFGSSMAIDGDYAVIGAQSVSSWEGAAYVFRRTGHRPYLADTVLTKDGAVAGDWFGDSVSVSGDTIAIGSHGSDGLELGNGAVFIYRRDGGIWTEIAKLIASNPLPQGFWGWSTKIDGNTVIAGSWGHQARPVYHHSINDRDGDGVLDGCDVCPNVPNGPDLGICVSGYVTPCASDDECDDPAGSGNGVCLQDLGICVAGLVTTCSTGTIVHPFPCGTTGECYDEQGDADLDGVGDVCDNCPEHYNPYQADYNDNGLGDPCDPAFEVAEELLPPDYPNDPGDPDDPYGDADPTLQCSKRHRGSMVQQYSVWNKLLAQRPDASRGGLAPAPRPPGARDRLRRSSRIPAGGSSNRRTGRILPGRGHVRGGFWRTR